MAGLIRQWCGQDITDGWVLHLVRKWLRAGYTAAELAAAIDGPPRGELHRYDLATMRRPRNVLLWRLSLHTDPLGRPWPPPSHVRAWLHNRLRQADAPLLAKSCPDWEATAPIREQLHAQPWVRSYRARKGIPVTELPSSFLNPPPPGNVATAEPAAAPPDVIGGLPVLYEGADASRPIAPLPPGTKIVLGYIGRPDLEGRPDTPHIWTRDEWNQYLDPSSSFWGGPDIRCSPIYVHDYPGDPAADAANAVAAFRQLGFADDDERILWWDSEMLIDIPYTQALAQEVYALGALLGKYGVLRTVNANPPVPGGSWVAELQPNRPRVLQPGVCVGQQWRFGQLWNSDVFSQWVYERCGRGPRKPLP